jgi:hypothetical protein
MRPPYMPPQHCAKCGALLDPRHQATRPTAQASADGDVVWCYGCVRDAQDAQGARRYEA